MRRLTFLPLLLSLFACAKSEPDAVGGTVEKHAAAGKAVVQMHAPVADYLAALDSVEKSKTPGSLEPLFDKAEAAQGALMEITGGEDGKAVMEAYDEASFTALQDQVRGLKLRRGLDIYAQPDPVFFLALAKVHGTPADIAFFTQYAATWGPDDVPVYLKLRPQPSPCVRFGEGRIAPLYAGWQAFATQHPSTYAQRAQQNLRDLEEAVALGTCACEGLESVRSEQAGFLKQFPATPKSAEIKARQAQLASDPEAMPVNCR
ncbi:MAG: hypothetical protein Q7J29_16185 [Stagnimonas sp.]|nr:hypothetical protein [Stagnimonas sp.]